MEIVDIFPDAHLAVLPDATSQRIPALSDLRLREAIET
jgi:hypothetical protein